MNTTSNAQMKPKQPTDAINSLRSVSEAYGMEWNEDTMLAIAVEFLNTLNVGDVFHQHCLNAAKASSSGTDDLGVNTPDDADEPGFFDVDVCRIGYGHRTLRIKADSREDAESKALDEAGNHLYSENHSDYTVEGITRLDEDNICRTCGVDESHCGDGYDGECPSCADKTERNRSKKK